MAPKSRLGPITARPPGSPGAPRYNIPVKGRVCGEPHCLRPAFARGRCRIHYMHAWRAAQRQKAVELVSEALKKMDEERPRAGLKDKA
mgnify:CR=1 FL=1